MTDKEVDVASGAQTLEDLQKNESLKSVAVLGGSLVVRTKESNGKAASNLAIVTIPDALTLSEPEKSNNDNTYTYKAKDSESAEKGTFTATATEETVTIKATSCSFDYSTDGGDKWTTLKKGQEKVFKDDEIDILVRVSGAKPTESAVGIFPSESKEVKFTYTPAEE